MKRRRGEKRPAEVSRVARICRLFTLTLLLVTPACEGEALSFGLSTPLSLSFDPPFVGLYSSLEKVQVSFPSLSDAESVGTDPLTWTLGAVDLGPSLRLVSFLFIEPFVVELELERRADAPYLEQEVSLQIQNPRGLFEGRGVITVLPATLD